MNMKLLGAIGALCLAASAAQAEVIATTLDTLPGGSPTYVDAPGTGIYDRFVVDQQSAVFSVTFLVRADYGLTAAENWFSNGICWVIKADANGVPGTAYYMASAVAPFMAGFSATDMGDGTLKVVMPVNDFLPLAPGVYWAGVGDGDPLQAPTYGTGGSALSYSKTTSSWVNMNSTLAFQIDGAINSVPEPDTWMLMLMGFGAIGAALRGVGRAPRKPKLPVAPVFTGWKPFGGNPWRWTAPI